MTKRFLYIFDMGGVVSEHCYVWNHICSAMGLSEYASPAQDFSRLEHALLRGDITSMEMLELVARRAQLPQPQENYWASFFKPTLNEATVSLIKELRAAGNRVVCGSNTIDAHYDFHIAHNQYDCFDAVYASHLIGQAKPDITFWHYIKQAEKCYDFTDMFFFDDMAVNVEAAASLGIHAQQFTTAASARSYIEHICGASCAKAAAAPSCESAPESDSEWLSALTALLQNGAEESV